MSRTHAYSLVRVGAALLCLALAAIVYADTLKLKDGTTIEKAKVIPQGDTYWVKLADGTTKIVKKTDVLTWTKGDGGATGAATPAAPPTTPPSAAAAAMNGSSG